ncbi:MAG: hypothetical protein A3G32_01280 [Deltaproteobacteria bacterium RIFCSPLOWO2_12_FULL_40_28]|nr:MAG: hypothetical protein A3C45_10165 [Deltaproteobacteria bacterium RIFCSPHIGHO2_02_FULL_40_28]OGQ19961.1 MAG: hypothetical protein A3E27_07115 [Deltaproteobacteria bacterium RIFCSPHIGHO2_12_FULL_40_32]OGQ39721.1 MAG: hypothetical protein A3I69_06545 [Deltaproteobacteria bacterium RIFCSPLOWO2_02_FULL_40_36]OGQ52976.1 MAG: hypothetical protein A3G32_01280 [Deltaproteobacteria bacterium RIFCSPLOWO2_12_FULL_40_28]
MASPQNNYSKNLLSIVRDVIWAQWNRLGLHGTGGINCYSTDIESSLILAAYGSRLDGRFYEGVWCWLKCYGNLVNGQRLATLIASSNDEWIARFFGGLLENTDPKQWKGVIQQCKKLLSLPLNLEPLLIHSVKREWRARDPVLSKWGVLYNQVIPTQKMQDHERILLNNSLMRYRYLYGTVIRADVFYLLSVSHHCRIKREIDFLTTVRLADRLCCYISTIHRIQKNLETGGFIHASGELKKKRAKMTTWVVKDLPCLQSTAGYDLGTIDWIKINAWLIAIFKLTLALEKIEYESISKVRIQEFQSETFHLLTDHGVHLPLSYGSTLGPLQDYSIEALMKMLVEALQMFYRIICCIILVRCRTCRIVFQSPIQGNPASMIQITLINNTITCPHCKAKLLLSKPDFFYYDGLGREQELKFISNNNRLI